MKKNKKNESINNEDNSEEEIYIGKANYKGTYQECMNEDSLDSFDNKIEKFLKKKSEDKKDDKKRKYNDDIINNNLEIQKIVSNKIEDFEDICYDESLIVSEEKSSISKENEYIIILDKSIKNNKHKQKDNISTNLKIIKNDQLEIFSHKNLDNIKEKYNEVKNEFKFSEKTEHSNKGYNLLYDHLTPNATTECYSKGGSNEDSNRSNMGTAIKDKIKRHSPNYSFDIILGSDADELKTKRDKTPLEFENNKNDISFLNSKAYDIKEENINDSDDEGTIHKTKDYSNFFKGVEIYQNKIIPYSEPNMSEYCEYAKQNKNKNSV